MKKLLSIIVALVAFVAVAAAQTVTCRIDGPANVRKSPSGSSAVMGSIRNGSIAEVSHASGDWWYIHRVYSSNGGSAYTGSAVGYYTHRQNLIFNNRGTTSSSKMSTTYPFSELSKRVYYGDDFYQFCTNEINLRILRNSIYARHGYIFKDQNLTRFFSQYSWYKPRYANVENQLTSIERQNVQNLSRLEKGY